jgi:hypothetical protein
MTVTSSTSNGGGHSSYTTTTSTSVARVDVDVDYVAYTAEETLENETPAIKIQPGEHINVVCPICEMHIAVRVTDRYMHPQTSPSKLDEIVAVYSSKQCDCPDITIKFRKES